MHMKALMEEILMEEKMMEEMEKETRKKINDQNWGSDLHSKWSFNLLRPEWRIYASVN